MNSPQDFRKAVSWLQKYHRLTNYLSVAQVYLRDNVLLEQELKPQNVKHRILGHWGTVPGLNLIYGGLNYLVSTTSAQILHVVGPGHGAPSTIANLYVEGTLAEFYDEYSMDLKGLSEMVLKFSWPNGFPSHVYPGTPGNIHEGGELGYSLGTAVGAALDNPDLLVTCVIGDGEAETGALASSWQSNKFLNPEKDGAVLPILHLNGYKISGPTLFASMSDHEINSYFEGLGWEPVWVDQYGEIEVYAEFLSKLRHAYDLIQEQKANWREGEKTKWPVIILKTMKGWTGPKRINGMDVEDNNLAHGLPLKDPRHNADEFAILKEWLEGYKVEELVNVSTGVINPDILEYVPIGPTRIGMNRHAIGGQVSKTLNLPKAYEFVANHGLLDEKSARGNAQTSNMKLLGEYIAQTIELNESNRNLRIFSPDEAESNKLEPIFKATSRQLIWPVREHDDYIKTDGRMMEILSEQTLQSWMQGYNLTGRHSIFISYEAFFNIISSQIDQYLKFLKKSSEFKWRLPLPSMNYVSTSTCWRQDHNGFSHQNPDLINLFVTEQNDFTRVYFPVDAISSVLTMEKSLADQNRANLIVSGKTDLPQWLSYKEAQELVEKGISVWKWASLNDFNNPDVVLASAGDYQTVETLAAIDILRSLAPSINIRYVNVHQLNCLGIGNADVDLDDYLTFNKPVIFNFHGYPEVIKQLVFGYNVASRIKVVGYSEEGSTTTPFDMQVQNQTSRLHIAAQAIHAASKYNVQVKQNYNLAMSWIENKLLEHAQYISEYGDDMPEIKNWKWKA